MGVFVLQLKSEKIKVLVSNECHKETTFSEERGLKNRQTGGVNNAKQPSCSEDLMG